MRTSRSLRTLFAALALTGGLAVTTACTVEDDDPDGTTVVEDNDEGGDGGEEVPDVNIENDNEDEAPTDGESPAG